MLITVAPCEGARARIHFAKFLDQVQLGGATRVSKLFQGNVQRREAAAVRWGLEHAWARSGEARVAPGQGVHGVQDGVVCDSFRTTC